MKLAHVAEACQRDSLSFTIWRLLEAVKRPVVLGVDQLRHQSGKAVDISLWGAGPGASGSRSSSGAVQ